MARGYVYKRPVKRSHYSNFRRQLLITVLFLAAFAAVGYFIYSGLRGNQGTPAVSKVENSEITGNKSTTINDYFQFQDTGQWVLDKNNSTTTKFTYHKFRKSVLEHEMVIYMNQVPIPLYLAAPRVLPVRIVNNNSLQTTNVSSPCVSQYAKGELHKVKELQVNNATMLCDPDSPQYFVVISEINGDYRLHLRRPNGTPVQFVITYKDTGLSPQPNSILNIASSFQTR
ncbi:hypothetical protein KW801_03460 [Candidatus Saccharibacteria bacterium]|nr:hypothetical protein [Candidatus Saccharibacteria bacterium]